MRGGGGGNVDSGNRRVWCTGNDIDEGGGVYAPFRPDMFCGGGSYRSGLGLDIYQVNVAALEGAEVPGDEHFVGLPGLPITRGSRTIFPVLGLPSDGPDLWNFDHMDSRGPSMISETSPAPTGTGDSEPDPPVLRYEFRLSGSESKTDYGAGTLHVSESSSFAWPVFLGNLGLGSGWPRLGSGVPPEGPDVDDDITNRLSQIIAQHNGKLLSRVLFCEEMAGVLIDVTLMGIDISWDSLIHCWKTGNVRLEDMMGVMTLFEDDQDGYNPPWWPEPSSCSCSVRIKGYLADVAVSCVLRIVHLVRLYLMGVTAVAGVMVSVASLTHLGGDCLERSGWLPIVMQWAGLMAPPMSAWLRTVVLFWNGEKLYMSCVHLADVIRESRPLQ